MKAIQHSQYYKNGNKMLVYKVFGTQSEIAQYLETVTTPLGRTPEDWPISEDKDKAPLHFVNATRLLQNGRVPKGQLNFIFNRDKTKIFEDTQADDKAMYARLIEKKEDAMARMLAERELGSNTNTGNRKPAAPKTTAIPTTKSAEQKLIDEMGEDVDTTVEATAGTLADNV